MYLLLLLLLFSFVSTVAHFVFCIFCNIEAVLSVRPSSRQSSTERVLSCESPVVFLHFPLGASKRETPTSNLTESTVEDNSNTCYLIQNVSKFTIYNYCVTFTWWYSYCGQTVVTPHLLDTLRYPKFHTWVWLAPFSNH